MPVKPPYGTWGKTCSRTFFRSSKNEPGSSGVRGSRKIRVARKGRKAQRFCRVGWFVEPTILMFWVSFQPTLRLLNASGPESGRAQRIKPWKGCKKPFQGLADYLRYGGFSAHPTADWRL